MREYGVCALCKSSVPVSELTSHWQFQCSGTIQSQIKAARRYEQIARAVTQPEPPLLARVWEQIEDIMVEKGFVR